MAGEAGRRPDGGIYASRAKPNVVAGVGEPGGPTLEALNAVDAGLAWLARAQEADGRWSCKRWDGSGDWDLGITGLALEAFLAAGHTHKQGEFRANVARALDWLKLIQKPDGSFPWKVFYEQGIATIPLCEAYGMTKDPDLKPFAQKAIDNICKQQPTHGGFRYQGGAENVIGDLSISGWQMTAIANARCAGLEVPEANFDRSLVFLKSTYCGNGGSAYVPGAGVNPSFSMTAAGMFCRQFLGGPEAEVAAGAKWLRDYADRALDRGELDFSKNLYTTYYTCLAMFQMGGDSWTRWNKWFRDPVVKAQVQERLDADGRYIRGSWDPAKEAFGKGAGRVYTTAMALLCLETYSRYARFYKTTVKGPTDF